MLITRPQPFANALQQCLQHHGIDSEIFSLIEVGPCTNQTELRETCARLNEYEMAIFSSQFAVFYSLPWIQANWPDLSSLPLQSLKPLQSLQWAAIGSGTAKALENAGISGVISPLIPPFETESLLQLPEFHRPIRKSIVIFRGNGGRDLLIQTLNERGAKVSVVQAYERRAPKLTASEREKRLKRWQENPLDVIITTSAQSLMNLVNLLGAHHWAWVKNVPMVVVGPRMRTLAKQFGVEHVIVAAGAEDQALLAALQGFKEMSL